MVAAMAYGGGRRPRQHPTRLPVLRLDVVVGLLLLFFVMGLYVPGLVGISGSGGRTMSLFAHSSGGASSGGGGTASLEEMEELKEQIAALAGRVEAAERESQAVMAENARVRLDNQVEQSNLKSMTKAKNDEIKRLNAEAEEVRKRAEKAEQELKRAQEEIETLKKKGVAATARANEAPKEPADGKQQQQQQQQQEEEKKHEEKKQEQQPKQQQQHQTPVPSQHVQSDDKEAPPSFLSKQLISVPEPQPLNSHWEPRVKELFDLALSDPKALLKRLDEEDPFGVGVEAIEEFSCPSPEQRLTQPDLRRMEIAAQFRAGKGFVFFQHLRKAGGTGFCDLAARSMPGKIPKYYCMPDERGTLATPPWNTTWLLDTMAAKGYRIAANEWDAFPRSKFTMADAVFATVMRDPTDRWYSQYRFEHLEQRDGHQKSRPFDQWYQGETGYNMGRNYYVKTFAGDENPPDSQVLERAGPKGVPLAHGNFYWSYDKYRGKEGEAKLREWALFARAVDTLRRFHLVLVLEWLNDGDDEIRRVLGWEKPPRQVLPHEQQAKRAEKTSKRARELLDPMVFAATREDNVLDHLFYQLGRRIFLERYACARDVEGQGAAASAEA